MEAGKSDTRAGVGGPGDTKKRKHTPRRLASLSRTRDTSVREQAGSARAIRHMQRRQGCASTGAKEANARYVVDRASVSISAKEANARMPWIEHLPAPARKKQMQGMPRIEHLRAPAQKEQLQGVRGIEHLRAPAPKEQMQGMQGIELPRCRIYVHRMIRMSESSEGSFVPIKVLSRLAILCSFFCNLVARVKVSVAGGVRINTMLDRPSPNLAAIRQRQYNSSCAFSNECHDYAHIQAGRSQLLDQAS